MTCTLWLRLGIALPRGSLAVVLLCVVLRGVCLVAVVVVVVSLAQSSLSAVVIRGCDREAAAAAAATAAAPPPTERDSHCSFSLCGVGGVWLCSPTRNTHTRCLAHTTPVGRSLYIRWSLKVGRRAHAHALLTVRASVCGKSLLVSFALTTSAQKGLTRRT